MRLDKLIRPELKEPCNGIGFILIAAAFGIHMGMIMGYNIPEWITVAAIFMYPVGFALFILADFQKKNEK